MICSFSQVLIFLLIMLNNKLSVLKMQSWCVISFFNTLIHSRWNKRIQKWSLTCLCQTLLFLKPMSSTWYMIFSWETSPIRRSFKMPSKRLSQKRLLRSLSIKIWAQKMQFCCAICSLTLEWLQKWKTRTLFWYAIFISYLWNLMHLSRKIINL